MLLSLFVLPVASLLQKASFVEDDKEKKQLQAWAEGEAKQIVKISELQFGEISHKTAIAHLLLADVYVATNR